MRPAKEKDAVKKTTVAERFTGLTAQDNVERVITSCRSVVAPNKLKSLSFFVMDDGSGKRYVAVLLASTQIFALGVVESFLILDEPYLTKNEITEIGKLLDFSEKLPSPVIYNKGLVPSTQSESVEDAALKLDKYRGKGLIDKIDRNGFMTLLGC
ncbi:hypothetical protein [Caballeronia sp. KNU42]